MTLLVRSKWFVAQYGVPIAVVLAIIGAVALGGAWSAYGSPGTRQVPEPVDQQRFGTAVGTSAVVTGETGLYEQGTTLEDQPVYFYNATPDLTVHVRTSVPEDRETSIGHRLVVRHVAARSGESFWETRRVLATNEETVADGEATMNATVDVRELRATVAEARSEIGGVGTFRTELRLHVEYSTDTADGELAPTSTLVLADRAYWLEGERAANETHTETETREVTEPPALGQSLVFGGFGVGLLLLAVGVAALQRREFDLETIEMEITRSRYEEWISRGEIPTKAEKEYITIDTLEDLVDIGIDSNKRVIYDTAYETYGVVDGDVVYYYTEGDDEFGAWLDV